jgi:hypothetical protein
MKIAIFEVFMGVKLRVSRNKLFLDIYHNGRRQWESLGLTLTPDKIQNREIMRLAEVCQSKREAQIISGEWGLVDPVSGKQTLIEYMGKIGKTRGKTDHVNKAVKYLEKYPAGNTALSLVNEKWLEDFQLYLLRETGLSKNTASHYESAVRLALQKATRDRVIPRNPAEGIKTISNTETDKVYLTPPEIQSLANSRLGGMLGAEVKQAFLFACFTGSVYPT